MADKAVSLQGQANGLRFDRSPAPQARTIASPGARRDSNLTMVLEVLGLAAAPTTLLSGALYWTGWKRADSYWSHFGIDQALLRYTTTDYVLRSVDTFFPVFVVMTVATIGAVSCHAVFLPKLLRPDRVWLRQQLKWALFTGGFGCLAVTFAQLFPVPLGWLDPFRLNEVSTQVAPILGMIGTAMITYARYLNGTPTMTTAGRTRLPRLSILAVGLMACLMASWVFWEAGEWATARGQEVAQAGVDRYPRVVLYSTKQMQIPSNHLAMHEAVQSASPYRYRSEGLRLLRFSKDRYFLLVDGADRRVIVLQESPDLRFEFIPPDE